MSCSCINRFKKGPKRGQKKELSYFSIKEETHRHLHQLNEGTKRGELEGKLISAGNWELGKKRQTDRQALSVKES